MSNYSSEAEVTAFTRHLLDGAVAFNSTTRPTSTEVGTFLTRVCGVLDVALAAAGLAVPITQTTAKLACDDWVTAHTAEYIELTQRGVGYSDGEGTRTAAFRNLQKSAMDFAKENRAGFINLGVTTISGSALSDGLSFTGLDAVSDRADPDDAALAQPKFTRSLFDSQDGDA